MKPQAVKLTSHRETYGLPPGVMVEEEAGIEVQGEIDQNDSEIFNDVLNGYAEPSLNDDTVRDSIKYSFVSSESEAVGMTGGTHGSGPKDSWVMNRMNWINYLKILFDELESFTAATQVALVK